MFPVAFGKTQLADRSQRIAAKLIDFGLLFIVSSIFALGWEPSRWLTFFVRGMNLSAMSQGLLTREQLSSLGGWTLVLLLIIQWLMLACEGQTIGKKALGIRVVDEATGKSGGFTPNVLWRSWVNHLLYFIPFYPLADALLIFRDDRRCAHDLLAGTKVVRA